MGSAPPVVCFPVLLASAVIELLSASVQVMVANAPEPVQSPIAKSAARLMSPAVLNNQSAPVIVVKVVISEKAKTTWSTTPLESESEYVAEIRYGAAPSVDVAVVKEARVLPALSVISPVCSIFKV